MYNAYQVRRPPSNIIKDTDQGSSIAFVEVMFVYFQRDCLAANI